MNLKLNTAMPIEPDVITWQLAPFDDLSPADLYAALQLRQRVFIVEQHCVYLDADGIDPASHHLLGWTGEGSKRKLVAYARLLPPGVKYPEPSIGRVITDPDHRRTGAGRELMREAIRFVEHAGWGSSIRIAAQMYLEKFYEDFGFARVSEPYLDDDIWHVDMLRG
jgi:ElaA protein